mmetsp:Transcript_14592/g.26161  ORF Transcript_14592/g.26161 Transcript_14592/m.26161 type:complete len:248 (-) Transcript_14592:252-995(-)
MAIVEETLGHRGTGLEMATVVESFKTVVRHVEIERRTERGTGVVITTESIILPESTAVIAIGTGTETETETEILVALGIAIKIGITKKVAIEVGIATEEKGSAKKESGGMTGDTLVEAVTQIVTLPNEDLTGLKIGEESVVLTPDVTATGEALANTTEETQRNVGQVALVRTGRKLPSSNLEDSGRTVNLRPAGRQCWPLEFPQRLRRQALPVSLGLQIFRLRTKLASWPRSNYSRSLPSALGALLL